ncbi:MAG: EAL domain-containing protein [Planctomycetota bacterium]
MKRCTDHEIVGRNALDFVVQEDHAHSLKAWFELLQRPGGFAVLEQRIRNKDGRDIWIEARLTNRLDDPDVAGIVSNFHAIDERKVAEERINQLANFDSLTGLPNRRLLQETLEQRLEQARSGGTGLTLLYMDLDRFKNVNDTLGHDVGDRLLVRVASAAAAIVGDGRMIARLGGDEFAVLIEGETLEATTAVAGELVAAMERPMHVDGYEVRLSASVGLARFPQHGQHADELFKHADIAMYRAKGERNRFAVFRAEDARAMRERVQVEKALQEAIDRQQFRLLYQPRVCLRTGRTVGVEALIRWDHPDRGTVPPDQFIPVAEETGLIYQIGEWVLNAACEQAARWRDRSFDLRVSINLSAHEMARSDIIEQVARALHTHGLDGPELELELTESAAMADLDEGLATLAQLRSQGVALSIDDFGTGHSSLSYLRRLPVDYLKIDQLFLPAQDAYAGTAGSALISGIILLAKSGGLRAVSEGVETRQQHDLLCQLGCDEAQGFYYAHPLPAEAIDELMTNGRSLVHASPPRA